MKLDREVHEQYQKAYALAKKNLQDKKIQRLPVCPAALSTLLDERMVSYRQDLGILDIPTNLIAGAAEESGQTMLYTKGFLPVSVPDSEYASLWCGLYQVLRAGSGFREAISCFEYLGKFYVLDGMKRVSVSLYAGAGAMKAHVIRILPMGTEGQEVSLYFDFLREYRLTQLYQLQFTRPGFFEKLQQSLGHSSAYRWSDADRESFLYHWSTIEGAFLKAYDGCLHITAADALVVLLETYSYSQIIRMPVWILTRVFQAHWKGLCAVRLSGAAPEKQENRISGMLQTA